MRIKAYTPTKSEKFIIEKHKPLIPTILFFTDTIGKSSLYTFKFSFWRWWYKIGFYTSE